MEVLKFLNKYIEGTPADALAELKAAFGIKHSYNEEYDLYVLNYDQIDSAKHKFAEIVCECRSLVLEVNEITGNFCVVSRSFDRFFNYGESDQEYHIKDVRAVEKMDGSLIGLFYHDGQWLYRTRSVIMPEGEINGLDVTWKDIIEPLMPSLPFMTASADMLDLYEDTFILELVAPHNRVVVRYNEPALRLLAVRDRFGTYAGTDYCDFIAQKLDFGRPREYNFDSWDEALEAAKELPNLEEGFVFYTNWDNPVLKIKNPAYVAAHHLRGEGVLNPKRICDLIIMGEVDEYLSVFPEDDEILAPYVQAHRRMVDSVHLAWKYYGRVADQKEFAMKVKDTPFAAILFSMKKGLTYSEAWSRMTQNSKREMINRAMAKSLAADKWRDG